MTETLPDNIEPYPGISSKAYEHPADRAATAALKAVPMLDTVVRKLIEYAFGRTLANEDTGLYKQLVVGFEDSKGDVRRFMTDLTTSAAFGVRGPTE